ncbi:N-(5'-phosphoribosyl)anthranilate isomerase [Methylophaga lonarensis MPL]|uniref:N-(5'-phosphoribosyl)anthranilate isomerase n=1 Tax=Methylophaga lonarensis MPL TaxID=1286106 RepID=M7NXE4_9GAMM|nr:phosphoribosylanthranilate isomerase [Methylophaga lonarensis]EMR13458.1 N-(5'-phosphoribosyl)anthranilate isomerase [Methylophaga lonarensis MPL]
MRTRVKICGITRRQDAEFAVNIGADALGLVFYPPSPRAVNIEAARTIVAQLPPFVSLVGLFVDAHAEEVNACLEALPIDILQFHGDESASYCEQFDRPYLKAIRMRDGIDLQQQSRIYSSAAGLLLDAYQPGVPGGTGQVFDWSMIGQLTQPIVLAGGLDAGNVASAIRQVRPYAVDVSGGVEAEKGIKSHQKISAFMQEVANA